MNKVTRLRDLPEVQERITKTKCRVLGAIDCSTYYGIIATAWIMAGAVMFTYAAINLPIMIADHYATMADEGTGNE